MFQLVKRYPGKFIITAIFAALPHLVLTQPAFITSELFTRQKYETDIAKADSFFQFVLPVFDNKKLQQNLCSGVQCKNTKARYFEVFALPDLGTGYSSAGDNFIWHAGAGLTAQFVSEKLVVSASYMLNWNNTSLPAFADSAGLYPGWGRIYSQHPNRYPMADFRILYKPVKWLVAEAGYSKHFLGYGIQSLWLSDNASPYPFVKFKANVWKLEYHQLYALLADFDYLASYRLQRKYASTHFLIYRPAKNFDIQVFESVIWRSSDSVVYRSFDINYINPVVFFRPVEYQLSDPSPDNVLLGAGCSYRFSQKLMLYSQLVVDEFNLNELKSGKQWWANKHGFQSGLKWFFPFGLKNLTMQAEYNYLRPYTYSHENSLKNFGHKGLPLAHPEGANFREIIFKAAWQYDKLGIIANISYLTTGTDTSLVSYGKDIYKPYTSRISDYHIKTGQGCSLKKYSFCFESDYKPFKNSDLSLYAGYEFILTKQQVVNYQYNNFVYAGITYRFFPVGMAR